MRTIFVYLLLAYYSYQASCLSNNVVDDTNIINELKITARSMIKDLNQYQNKYLSDSNLILKEVQDDSLTKTSGTMKYVTNSIKTAVKAVSVTGKDAASCLEACRISLRDVNKSTNKELDQCYHAFSFYIEPILKEIRSTIKKGENILSDLEDITIGCTKHVSTGDCLSEKLDEVEKTLRNMQVHIAGIKSTGSSAMNKAKTVVTSCSEKAVRSMHVEATFKIQRKANACVRNIYKQDY
ncbi:uncharacterized protein LOC117181644 [Belonocnema kinseyi]|uniref:uncharacterized protein LOC117181644 n=1 Tax=Belonocnema kinseyi TaxID=2817044 RepID=UPI00143CCBA4|nr:uncharacterized protein LOC117181644 [Belonocnema kinseyi]